MTREEAINAFKEWIERDKKIEYADRLENIEIYKLAIKAIEQTEPEKRGDCISRQAAKSKAVYSHERHEKVVPVAELDWLPSVEPEKCGDCISRQDLLNAIFQKEYGHDYDGNTDILGLRYVDIIKGMPSVKLETCVDCISRQAALKKFTYSYKGERIPDYDCDNFPTQISFVDVRKVIREIPSVEPERKPGKWINVDGSTNTADCSCCGNRGRAWMNYCYECGSTMKGGVTYNVED